MSASVLLHAVFILLVLFRSESYKRSLRLLPVRAAVTELVSPTTVEPLLLPLAPQASRAVTRTSFGHRPGYSIREATVGTSLGSAPILTAIPTDIDVDLGEPDPVLLGGLPYHASTIPFDPIRDVTPLQPEFVDEPIAVDTVVVLPVLLQSVKPAYPRIARLARVQGDVEIEAVVGEDGKIIELTVVSGHPLLIESAAESVRKWRYSPAILHGVAVKSHVKILVRFQLIMR